MTPVERAVGWLTGPGPRRPDLPWRTAPSPRDALAARFRATHERGAPLYIAFSGGLDSSLLLAVAAETARREGHPLPVPVTNTYVDDHAADETEWQRLVLRHLDGVLGTGLEAAWQQVPLDPRDDLVGPHAVAFLRRHGVCWPNAFLVNSRSLCAALPAGATLMTGDGGDEALGQRRITGLAALRAGRRPTRAITVAALRGAAPRPLRRWDLRRPDLTVPPDRAWVRPPLRQQFLTQLIEDELREPLRHRSGTAYWAQRRVAATGRHNMTALAAEHGVRLEFPLWSDEVTAALQREAGVWGWLTRAEIVGRTAGDLLPDRLVRRRSKATFNTVVFGPSFRELVDGWDGSGLDEELVDAAALRAEWAADVPHGGTMALAQQVALAAAGG